MLSLKCLKNFLFGISVINAIINMDTPKKVVCSVKKYIENVMNKANAMIPNRYRIEVK
ncbi:conserved domain protein [Ruminococcus albus 8]|uniref:Conserved domain protein n=1 Tax=Ruminococcus albus 8 TaxID=246199 RepID=E9SCK3_RUMAL|nr:conserved domain protein [Ruminococcus albus 8]